ncbi:MAG: WcaF family extracellular polysaccharide biosynthesis acetyltransferase [Janthinobacterium lividum]
MSSPVQLARYDNSWYSPGRSFLWRALWLFIGLPLFRCALLPFSGFRVALLRLFGAQVGQGVVIHSEVNVKYPWHLQVGNHCWIGERAWIDNLTTVRLGDNTCLSQDCYICTGNHNWSDPLFGLIVKPVELHAGAWAAARSTLMPGVVLGEGAIAGAGSVVAKNIPAYEVHTGNPAVFVRTRHIQDAPAERTGRETAQ